MKVTLDLDQLLQDGRITPAEYQRLLALAAKSTGSLAFNILIGFGVVAVSGAALALVPSAATAIGLGLLALLLGLGLLRSAMDQWTVLANICILVGALMGGGGIIGSAHGSLGSILAVAALLAVAAAVARSALLAVLATFLLSASLGARTGYFHASYFLVIEEPSLTITLFGFLGIALYLLARRLPAAYARLAIAASRTSLFLVNFGFWVGSLWGDRTLTPPRVVVVQDEVFAVLWAVALVVTALWAWQRNRRWVLNTVATFAGIHFYTQWFETLGATPGTVLAAGLLALASAIGLKFVNTRMKTAG